MRTQTRTLHSVLLMPTIFVVWGLFGLYQRGVTQNVMPWLLAFFVGALISQGSNFNGQLKFSGTKIVVSGSIWPLMRMQTVFWAHYVLHVLSILQSEQCGHYLAFDVIVSGASAGYFFGYALTLWRALQRLSRLEVSAEIAPPQILENHLLP